MAEIFSKEFGRQQGDFFTRDAGMVSQDSVIDAIGDVPGLNPKDRELFGKWAKTFIRDGGNLQDYVGMFYKMYPNGAEGMADEQVQSQMRDQYGLN